MHASPPPAFDRLLRRTTRRDRLAPLLRALGLEPCAVEVELEGGGGEGEAGREVRYAAIVAERGGLTALLAELEAEPAPEGVAALTRRLAPRDPRPRLFLFASPGYRRLAFASAGLEGEVRQLFVDRLRPRQTDLETLAEMAAREGEGGVALALRHARALDRTRVTRRFFADFRAARARVAGAWRGLARGDASARAQLALLFLSRLMFLYFLQRQGHLAGAPDYLPGLLRRWQRGDVRNGGGSPGTSTPTAAAGRRDVHATFFRSVLQPLFFGALNTRPEARDAEARALGPLPYLNGGLFERHGLERRHPHLDLPDAAVAAVFDELLERYRFTTREASQAAVDGAQDLGIDPEMLGRVFEGLMAPERRGATGTFYTPARVVDRLVRESLAAGLGTRAALDPERAAAVVERGEVAGLTAHERARLAAALRELRVLDPACGSGAFLVGALSRLARIRTALAGPEVDVRALRREIVAKCLHGVDLQEDAALLCALRLWLALAAGPSRGGGAVAAGPSRGAGAAPPAGPRTAALDPVVPPLPNLDRRIRQGDALLDPLDLLSAGPAGGAWRGAAVDGRVRAAVAAMRPLGERYLTADPAERPALRRGLAAAETELATAWTLAVEARLRARLRELRADALARDLFGGVPASARQAEAEAAVAARWMAEVEATRASLADKGALPFFSFGVHFAEGGTGGFDLILSNPPWVRARRWPAAVGRLVRTRYEVCRAPGWRPGAAAAGAPAAAGGQIDLALLFLERALGLLAPGGTLGMVLPAKALRSLYGAGGRRLLVRGTRLVAIEDHSLDQRSIFRADAFAATVVAVRAGADTGRGGGALGAGGPTRVSAVRVTMVRRDVAPLRFAVSQDELPLVPGDVDAPWLLAPPEALAALRRMQAAGPPLTAGTGLRVRRGIVTGANDVLLVPHAEAKLGGLARIRALGARNQAAPAFQAMIEADALRPLVRGAGIEAWSYRAAGHLVWTHDDESAAPHPPPPRAARYLARHDAALRARSGWHPALPDGAVFRVTPDTLRPKVAWHDLSDTLKAVALPARVRGVDGRERPLIPLNTVYFIPVDDAATAQLLAAYMNSLPVRTFARAVAERAKDARFRFFAWCVAMIPLPDRWSRGPAAARLLALSAEAHRAGCLAPERAAELDRLVAASYRLEPEHVQALAHFDAWLRGVAT